MSDSLMSKELTAESARNYLRAVIDPEIYQNIVDLGLVYGVEVQPDQSVDVTMTLTTPHCPMGPQIIANVEQELTDNGASAVRVHIVWKPMWTPDAMTDELKRELGIVPEEEQEEPVYIPPPPPPAPQKERAAGALIWRLTQPVSAITVDEVTPEWLTEVLHRQNALPSGKVVAVEKQPTSAFNSHTLHLILRYSGADAAITPSRLLLKCSLPAAWAMRAGAREVAFYKTVKALPDHPDVIVRCYEAVYDAESGNSHILLQDLTESHVIPVERGNQINFIDNLPSTTHLAQAVEALARFHAYWWQHPLLGTAIAPISWGCSDETQFTTEIARRRSALDHLLTQNNDWLPSHVKLMYENILAQMMHLWRTHMRERVATLSNLTLTHGDAYLANFLCPQEGQTGTTYIIDWQCPETYRGSSDLVNMCATFWTREQRAEGERELNVLRQYHRTLQENGVSDYAWENLVTDYQLSIIDWLLIPLQDAFDGAGKAYWWPKMQCLTHAFEDWHCADLFAVN